ncbi:MAG: dihydropteroate synthase [Dehalococcoidia bacterium]|nr:dihydropteroate synthase [Dehalococcoidia bacterium]
MTATRYLFPFMICGNKRLTWGERTYVMGVVNVTPDSFSGDGVMDVEQAVAWGKLLVEEGADILDVGGESTRPPYAARIESRLVGAGAGRGATRVQVEEELRRVIPVIQRLAEQVDVPISVDTYKAEVARSALEAGAAMINDVWGLKADPELAAVAAEHNVPLVLMHNQLDTEYADLISDIRASLGSSVQRAVDAGVRPQNIILDPGFGFGKKPIHNLDILRRLGEFKEMGYPLLMGTSRKSTIGLVLGLPVQERLEGTAATVAIAIANGADIIRVHDVKAMSRVARMTDSIVRGWTPPPER